MLNTDIRDLLIIKNNNNLIFKKYIYLNNDDCIIIDNDKKYITNIYDFFKFIGVTINPKFMSNYIFKSQNYDVIFNNYFYKYPNEELNFELKSDFDDFLKYNIHIIMNFIKIIVKFNNNELNKIQNVNNNIIIALKNFENSFMIKTLYLIDDILHDHIKIKYDTNFIVKYSCSLSCIISNNIQIINKLNNSNISKIKKKIDFLHDAYNNLINMLSNKNNNDNESVNDTKINNYSSSNDEYYANENSLTNILHTSSE